MYSEAKGSRKVGVAPPLNQGTVGSIDPSLRRVDPGTLRANIHPVPDIYSIQPGTFMNFSPVRSLVGDKGAPVTSRIHQREPIPALATYQKMNKKNTSEFLTYFTSFSCSI